MRRFFWIIVFILAMASASLSYAGPSITGGGGGGSDQIGTLTNTKWCSSDGSVVNCTEDAPAGAGDVTGIGDAAIHCDAGDCTYFALGGVRLGDAEPDADGEFGYTSPNFLFYGGNLVPSTNNAYALGGITTNNWSDLFLGSGSVINFSDNDVTLTHSANTITLAGGNLALGANNLTITGSIAATGAGKATKIWTVDLESTNAPTVNGTAANATGGLVTNPMTTAGDLITGGAAGVSTGRIEAVAAGQPLLSGGVGTASAYAGYTFSGTAAQTYTFPAASATLAGIDAPVFTTSIEAPFLILGSAATAADAGTIRMPNAGSILFEADAAGVDVNALSVDSSEIVQIGSAGASAVTITPATTVTGLITANGGIVLPEAKLIDLSAITMTAGADEGLALPTYADVAPTTEKNYVAYDAANNALMVREAGGWVNVGASAAAPTNAKYIVFGASGNLSDERVITEGLSIDFTDAGTDGGNYTIAFDPTELTGNRTFAAGGAATVTWTWDNSGATDPALVFGDGVITSNSALTPTVSDGVALGSGTAMWSDLFIGSGGVLNFNNGNVTLTHGAGTLTLGGAGAATLALGTNSITMSGSLAATGARVTKGWFTDVESTNAPSVNGTAANATGGLVTNPMTAVGDIIIGAASGASTGRLADVAAGQALLSGGVGANPAYAGYTFSGTAAQTYTFPSATDTLAGLAAANTFTANNVFGNADTDTVSIRGLLLGADRTGSNDAVQIAAVLATPTYAVSTNELYVAGDIETPANVYANAFVGGTGTNEQRGAWFTSNTSMTSCYSSDGVFFLNDVGTLCENGTQRDILTPADAPTLTGASWNFAAVTNLRLPTADADSSGEISINATNHQLKFHAGGASADNALQTYDYDSCGANQVHKTNGSGVWTCADDVTAGSPQLDTIVDPTADTTIVMDADEEVNFDYTGNFTAGSQFRVRQVTGNPSGGVLFEVIGTDTDITLAKIGDGTNGITVSSAGALTASGTGTITATALAGSTAYTVSKVNAASGSADALTMSGTLGAFNGSDTFRSLYLNYANANHTSTGNVVALIDIAAMTGDANSNFYGLRFGDFTGTTGAAGESEQAINVGSGYDFGLYARSPVYIGDTTNGITVSASGALTMAGTASITAGGLVLGDASPDADGEIGYATNAYLWFANSEDLALTASANLWTFSSTTSATFAFTPAVAVNGAFSTTGASTIGDAGDDVVVKLNVAAGDGTFSGQTITRTVDAGATGSAFGQCMMIGSDGELETADADAAATGPCVCILVTAGTGASKQCLISGTVTETDWNWTPGAVLYLGTDPATTTGLVATAPSGTGDVVQRIAVALSADTILVMPSLNVIVLE